MHLVTAYVPICMLFIQVTILTMICIWILYDFCISCSQKCQIFKNLWPWASCLRLTEQLQTTVLKMLLDCNQYPGLTPTVLRNTLTFLYCAANTSNKVTEWNFFTCTRVHMKSQGVSMIGIKMCHSSSMFEVSVRPCFKPIQGPDRTYPELLIITSQKCST